MVGIDTPMNGWSHLAATNLEELHTFAQTLGLWRSWFQDKPGRPHYDVRAEHYHKAIALGAVPMKRRELVEMLRQHYEENSEQ